VNLKLEGQYHLQETLPKKTPSGEFAVEVDDIGGGMPLYKEFGAEDWTLMTLCHWS